jgi:hypothetical protein
MGVRRAALLAPAALILAACGQVHPGAAAVVDGRRISFDQVDATARGYCELVALQGQEPDAAALRRQALADRVALDVARELAEQRDLAVPRSEWIVPVADREGLAEALPDADVEQVIEAAELNGRLRVTLEVLGSPAGSPEVAQQQGRDVVAQELADRDVQVDPRLGLDESLQDTGSNGSLSVRSGDAEPAAATGCA